MKTKSITLAVLAILLCYTRAEANFWTDMPVVKGGWSGADEGGAAYDEFDDMRIYRTKPKRPYRVIGTLETNQFLLQSCDSVAVDRAREKHADALIRIGKVTKNEKGYPTGRYQAIKWLKQQR
ncbi:MAG: hypothetical protein PHP75_06285 [Methylacidiphilaceae bacterium]|nr:hypothetical protein [Candidatus Methylacidiphilaceae bacterium]